MADARLIRLLTWLSPAFPTGGFAYSQGLEWAVEAGDVTSAASLAAWLADVLAHGGARSEAILLRHAHAAHDDAARLEELTELAAALAPARERAMESMAQGVAFVAAAAAWWPKRACVPAELAYPVAVGALAGAHAIEVEDAAAAYLHAVMANLVSAAVRLVPLGQSAGLGVLAALEAPILGCARGTRGAGLDEIGGACFRADIAAMRHETQYTRLFRS